MKQFFYIITLLFLTAAINVQLASDSHAAELQKIEIISEEESTQVVLHLNKKTLHLNQYLPAVGKIPGRCYVDLYSTSKAEALPSWISVENDLLSKIRTGLHATTLRVVLDLKKGSDCSITTATDPFRVFITVTGQSGIKSADTTAAATTEIVPQAESRFKAEQPSPFLQALQKKQVTDAEAIQPADPMQEQTQLDVETHRSLPEVIGRKEVSTWGWIRMFSAWDTAEDNAEDERLSRLRARLGADWDADVSSDYSLQLHGSLEFDRLFYDDELADEKTELNLYETYLQLNGSNWDLSLGKQRVRWGKSDQLSPLDSINPQDFRQFITVDLEERKIPSWLIRTRWYGESTSFETILQPWFEKSELDYFDSDWALYRHLRQSISSHPLSTPFIKNYAAGLEVHEKTPANSLENISAGARFIWNTEQADFGISYHYGWETLPTISRFPVKNIHYTGDPNSNPAQLLASAVLTDEMVQATYKRQQTAGFEWETVFDLIGFRGEIAYIDKVAFLTGDLTSQRKAVTHLVTGIDYTSETEWYFNIQGSWHHIHDYEQNILYFEEETVSVLGEIRKPVWRGNLEFSTKYNYTMTDQSSYLQPSLNLKYFPNTECEIGAMIFSGDAETLLGSYDQADQIYTKIKISF